MAAQYEAPDGYVPAMTVKISGSKQDGKVLLGVVWPDTGQDTVTLDLPGNGKNNNSGLVARLTDIPVEEL